ncbi:hypothetical protein BO70DRAFT_225000 [Aspergillus heteromorphus CBS 117.55]|uniref:Survival Motor Neuron Gemin2-binding domain-containing protein n=1 Tax=Aspergillus heteromorphus CBS 117.55 TaxID=1448321 RepID=A0A317WII3_9EURO|nr:uncharacterized protein BO70DRAFT_225000 [Aspergillus heteromorphus CBS 117.55]PWY86284.1 hypothetical protein BO70DRAFT_225000 [Aspergillus heteromorphus CBS 117.55]
MGKTKNANKPLTQEEIWDDSALVQSWDEAVEEYKLYHSIQAKGENVEDVLREAEAAENAGLVQDDQPVDDTADHMDADVDVLVVDAAASTTAPVGAHQVPQVDTTQTMGGPEQSSVPSIHETTQTAGPGSVAAAPMPHPALSQVQDEGLKNLMMSWYFAGYYTGLYEGQQRANQNQSS